MKRNGLLVVLLVAALATVGFARRDGAAAPEATVTYYFIPGCSTCARMSTRLTETVAAYEGRVALRLVENRSPEGRDAAQAHGFASHGLVLTDRSGHEQLVEADHRVFPEHVVAALGRVLPATR